jgi:hypothetical protein
VPSDPQPIISPLLNSSEAAPSAHLFAMAATLGAEARLRQRPFLLFSIFE